MAGLKRFSSYVITATILLFPALTFAMVQGQPDYSIFCPAWRSCAGTNQLEIPLGQGNGQTLQQVQLYFDETSSYYSFFKAQVLTALTCYTDSSYTTACAPASGMADLSGEFGSNHVGWALEGCTANSPYCEANYQGTLSFGSSGPVLFNTSDYYKLVVNDDGWNIGAYFDSTGTELYFSLLGISPSIDWNAINLYTPLVYDASSSAIAASSSLWGAFSTTTQLVQACNTGNPVIDLSCSVIAYLFVPNPQLLNGALAIPNTVASKAPFSMIESVVSLVNTFTSNVSGTTTDTNSWHYQSGPASSTITIFDASSSVADFPLITTMRDYAGDFIYVGWGVSALFVLIKLI